MPPHVFISYARATAREAQAVAAALRNIGHAVWLDDEIPAHRAYADVIEERLREARAVVVVWSAEAARSEWVRSEADRARAERKLVQLRVDGAPLPMPFDQIQCADLAGWDGDPGDPAWRKVVGSVVELVGSPTLAGEILQTVRPREPAAPEKFSIAVATFADRGGAAAGDDLAQGLTADLATALARFPALLVADAGPGSGERYLLGGSIQRAGPRARINVQLSGATNGDRVWAERFEGALDDPFALQDDVASMAAGRIESAILAHETRRIAARSLESLSAPELWLRARETIRRGGLEQVDELEELSERALALDPRHAPSLGFLACALGFRIAYGGSAVDMPALRARVDRLIDQAMVLGADDPEVLSFVAEAQLLSGGDMVVARALADRALQINPGLGTAWDISANIRLQFGEYEDALVRYQRCLHLDPQSPWRTWVWPSMGGCLLAMGRLDEALVHAKEGLQISPNNPWAAAFVIAALAHLGRVAEAREALARFDPRQLGVFDSRHNGPKLTAIINEALAIAAVPSDAAT